MSEELSPTNRKFLKYRKTITLVAIVLIFIAGDFGIQGFNFWRAQGHITKACNLLYGLGNSLRENSQYGTDLNQLSASQSTQMSKAASEAISAQSAENKFAFFRDEVILFDLNMRGEATVEMENLASPYSIYTYGIYPVCTNSVQFFDPARMNWLPDL